MEQINALRALLMAFPQWGAQELSVDGCCEMPDTCTLLPRGLQVLECRENVLGGCTLRLRQEYLLRRRACLSETAAVWLSGLQQWLTGCSGYGLASAFGDRPMLTARQGRLTDRSQPGTGSYEVIITVDYTKEMEYGKN